MKQTLKTFASIALCSTFLTGCQVLSTQVNPAPTALVDEIQKTSDTTSSFEKCLSPRAIELLSKMTLEEKIGQLHQAAGGRSKNLNSRLNEEEFDKVRRGEIGSYLHVAGAAELKEIQRVALEESTHGIPLLFAMDVVHGYRTIYPVPIAMAASWDDELMEQASRMAGRESASSGLHWTFAPMVDIARDPRWGRIVEGAGSDPYLGSRMSEAQVKGFQNGDLSAEDTVLATTKHIGVYGAPTGGRDYGTSDVSERTVNEVYLPPFYAANQAGSGSYMTAFNDIAGIPTTANEELVDGVLRSDWGFCGMIVSDWNAIHELTNHGIAKDRAEAGSLALQAGVDMDMTSEVYKKDLINAIKENPNLENDLNLAAGRIITVKEQLGLFDKGLQYHDVERERAEILKDENRALARKAAQKTAVLLKNENNALPITEPQKIAVIGGLAKDTMTQLGSWRARGDKNEVVSLLDGLTNNAPEGIEISYAKGTEVYESSFSYAPDRQVSVEDNIYSAPQADLAKAIETAEAADRVVLVIGEHYDWSGEARARTDIELPENQMKLAEAIFKTGKPVTVVLVTGRAMAIPELDEKADAILNFWMSGVEAGNALADIVYGKVSPAGRLPINFPRKTGQVPFSYSENPSGRPAHPNLAKDTNRSIDVETTPLYPFGHGLSYSSFEYGELTADTTSISSDGSVQLTTDVTNTGDMVAEEVVQLYMRDPYAFVARPRIELRGYKRISLEPGETAKITFTVQAEQSGIYVKRNEWLTQEGELKFFIGRSSSDLESETSINVTDQKRGSFPAAAIKTKVEVSK